MDALVLLAMGMPMQFGELRSKVLALAVGTAATAGQQWVVGTGDMHHPYSAAVRTVSG